MSGLVIAGHGTRVGRGQDECRALVSRVREMLAPEGVIVHDGYVELTDPTIDEAVAEAITKDPDKHVVVVPLMIGTGGHVRQDIPEAFDKGARQAGGSVSYTPHLGPDARLRAVVRARIDEALGEWAPQDVTVVFLGRGTTLTEANANHVHLGRVLREEGGYGEVVTGFIQVTTPDLTTALDQAYGQGARRIVVMPHFLFPGRLEDWTHEQAAAWSAAHGDAQVRIARIIGDCDELAQVVVDRYHDAVEARLGQTAGTPVYLSGLALRGRKVVIVGGGRVAARRVGKLVSAGARIEVVAPVIGERMAEFVATGQVAHIAAEITPEHLDGAWYVLACTDVPEVNARVVAWAEAAHTFCVRSDAGVQGTAWTPATGLVDGMVIGVVGSGDPHASAAARTTAVAAVRATRR